MNRKLEVTQRCVLLLSGALLLLIGSTILVSPISFYAVNNIDLNGNASLINELKAPAGFLLLAGVLIVSAFFIRRYENPATCLAALIYLSYALSRMVSFGIDGVPSSGLIQAAVIEAVLGLSCVMVLAARRFPVQRP